MSLPSVLATLALVVALGGAAVLHERNQELEERLGRLEGLRAAGESGDAATSGAPALSGGGMGRHVAELQGVAEGLARRVDVLESRDVPAGGTARPVEEQVAALASSSGFHEAVRGVVLDMATNDVDFRARIGTQDRMEIPKDAPFSRVAEALKLDASQEDRMSKDLQAMQQDLFGLLAEERDDGVVPMEIIAKAEEYKEGDPRKAEAFMKLFTLKIPGEDDTYMQRAVKLQTEFRKQTLKYLRPEQNEIWDAMKVDWFSIKFN